MSDRMIRERECRQMSGLSRTTRWRLERAGQFPRRRIISLNAVGWLESEVQDWLRGRQASGSLDTAEAATSPGQEAA